MMPYQTIMPHPHKSHSESLYKECARAYFASRLPANALRLRPFLRICAHDGTNDGSDILLHITGAIAHVIPNIGNVLAYILRERGSE